MFEIQHRSRELWYTEDRWGLIAFHDTLGRCIEGVKRITTPMSGETPRTPDDYRIVQWTSAGVVKAMFDREGNPMLFSREDARKLRKPPANVKQLITVAA